MAPISLSIDSHFEGRSPVVRQIYAEILAVAGNFGPFEEDPKKTSIHLNRRSAFAGVATRKDCLILTVKAEEDIESPRVSKHEQASAHRWHLEIRLHTPGEVDSEVVGWLRNSYEMSE